MSKMPNKFVDIHQDLGYAVGILSRPVYPNFKVKWALKRAYLYYRQFLCAIANHFYVIQITTSKMPKFLVDVCQDLGYASGWPLRPVRPTFKVKRAPKWVYPTFWQFSCAIANLFKGDPDSDVKNSNIFCGRLSRPCLCSRLSFKDSPTHFQGQMIP